MKNKKEIAKEKKAEYMREYINVWVLQKNAFYR
jgi:hypothetical protein